MSNIKKLDWYWRSGGAAQAFDSPAPLLLLPISATRIDTHWLDVGQTNSKLYIDDILEYDGAGFSFSKTGLTRGQEYDFRLVVTNGSLDSVELTGSASTLSLDILSWFEFSGLEINTTNDYGSLTSGSVDTLKSVFSSAKTATAVGSKYVLKPTHPKFPYHRIGQTTHTGYSVDNPDTLTDFTVIAPEITIATLGSSNRFLTSNTAGDISLQLVVNTTLIQIRLSISGTNYNVSFAVSKSIGETISPGWRRNGTTFYGTIDGGQTWTAYGSAVPTTSIVVDKLFAGLAGINPFWHDFGPRLVFLNGGDYTSDELTDVTDYFRLPVYVPDTVPDGEVLSTKGLDYSDLTDGHLADTMSFDLDSGNKNFDRLKSVNNLHFFALNANCLTPDFSDGLIAVYNSATKKISEQVNIGHYIDNDDVHANNSVAIYDRTVDYLRPSVWYGLESNTSTFKRKSSGKNFNFTEINERVYAKGVASVVAHHCGYYQEEQIGSTRFLFMQENGKESGEQLGQYCTVLISTDNFNSYQKVRIINSGGDVSNAYWVYHRIAKGPDGIHLFWKQWDSGGTKMRACGHVKTTDGITWTNNSESWSKNTETGGAMTMTELYANALILDATSLTADAEIASGYCDENDLPYCVLLNGDDDGYYLWNNGTLKAIDFLTYTVDYSRTGALMEIVKTGASEFHLFFNETGEANARTAHIKTTDGGDNWTDVGLVNHDASIDYGQIHISKNHHFNDDAILAVTVPTTGFNNKASITEIKLNGSYTI